MSSAIRDWLREDEFFIDFNNPREFVIDRWQAAVDSHPLPDADRSLVDNVTDAQSFQEFMRTAVKEARLARHASRVNPLITISQIYQPLWQFAKLIADIEEDVEDVAENVDVSPLWSMVYLNVKLSMNSVDKLKRTASWMNEYRRQIELLLSSLKHSADEATPLRIEMSEMFEPALGILHDSIIYLQRHYSDEDFVHNWYSGMQTKSKQYLEQMEATVKHIRAMGATKQINQIQEARLGELAIREREYPMDGSEKAIFPVDNLPQLRTEHFTGRRKEIENIHTWLGAPDNKRLRTYLIYGRRGIGKTQIALEYSARHKTDYNAIFWIQCETSASLRQSFADIAIKLELDGADKDGHYEENLVKVNKWLKHTDKKWLMIYDNAERENLLKGFWPVGARGSILLTSRTYYNFFEDDQRQGETVQTFDPEESYTSLMAQLGTDWQNSHLGPKHVMAEVESTAAKTLLKQTGGLPLAIKHASRLILNKDIGMNKPGGNGDDSIHGFLAIFGESHKNLPPRQTGPRDALVHSLDTIWSIAFDALSPNAAAILSVLALVSPDVILIDLFLPSNPARLTDKLAFCRPQEYTDPGRPSIQSVIKISDALSSALEELSQQGMVTKVGRQMAIHREVQEAVNYRGKDDLTASFDAAVNLLYDAFPFQREGRPMTDDKEICRRWIQHAIALATRYKIYSIGRGDGEDPLRDLTSTEMFVRLIANCAWYLYEVADYDESLNLIGIAGAACRNKNSLDYAHLMNTEGSTYYELNKLKKSRDSHELALQIRETTLPRGHGEIAISRSNLGNVESAQGRYDEALDLLRQTAAMREQLGDSAAVLLAVNYLQIGRVHFLLGNLNDSYKEYQRCEGVLMKKVGRGPWFMADLFYAYGNLEYAQEEWSLASKSYERARRVCQEFNPLHPLTAAVHYKMGCAEFEQDHHSKALGCLEKALNIAEIRSPNVLDGTIARIQWKRAEIVLDYDATGPDKRKEFQDLKDEMELRQTEIAASMDVDLQGLDRDDDREKSFDLLIAGYYR